MRVSTPDHPEQSKGEARIIPPYRELPGERESAATAVSVARCFARIGELADGSELRPLVSRIAWNNSPPLQENNRKTRVMNVCCRLFGLRFAITKNPEVSAHTLRILPNSVTQASYQVISRGLS